MYSSNIPGQNPYEVREDMETTINLKARMIDQYKPSNS